MSALGVVVWSQGAGLAVLAIGLFVVPGRPDAVDLAIGAGAGVIGAAAVGLLYRGLARGAMGVVSPLTAVLAALVPVAYGLPGGRVPSAVVWIGIGLGLAATVVVAAGPAESLERARRGVPEACAAGVLFGIFFIALAATHAAAGLWPLVGARVAAFAAFGLAGALVHADLRPPRTAVATIVTGGACDMLANVLYAVAAHRTPLAVVVVLTSLYPASTVALAAVVLHERLGAQQWAGVVLAVAAVVCLSAGR